MAGPLPAISDTALAAIAAAAVSCIPEPARDATLTAVVGRLTALAGREDILRLVWSGRPAIISVRVNLPDGGTGFGVFEVERRHLWPGSIGEA